MSFDLEKLRKAGFLTAQEARSKLSEADRAAIEEAYATLRKQIEPLQDARGEQATAHEEPA